MRHTGSSVFIFNPAADKGRAVHKEELIKQYLQSFDNAVLKKTQYPGHATEMACDAASEGTAIVACGGDGTLNEIINAVVGMPVRIGILPTGSANDFLKTLDPKRKSLVERLQAMGSCSSGSTRKIDLGRTGFESGHARMFINSLGIGLTGRIAKAVKSTVWLRGELLYLYALVKVLLDYNSVKMHISVAGPEGEIVLDEPVFAFSVSNGRIEGGKFRIAPEADPSDGLLDVCILRAIRKWSLPRYVLKYLRGTQVSDPRVLCCKATSIVVFLSEPETMHMDGEVFDGVCGQVTITAVPSAVNMLCYS